jgi:hypothetical protein
MDSIATSVLADKEKEAIRVASEPKTSQKNGMKCPFCRSTNLGFARETRINDDGKEEGMTACGDCNNLFFASDYENGQLKIIAGTKGDDGSNLTAPQASDSEPKPVNPEEEEALLASKGKETEKKPEKKENLGEKAKSLLKRFNDFLDSEPVQTAPLDKAKLVSDLQKASSYLMLSEDQIKVLLMKGRNGRKEAFKLISTQHDNLIRVHHRLVMDRKLNMDGESNLKRMKDGIDFIRERPHTPFVKKEDVEKYQKHAIKLPIDFEDNIEYSKIVADTLNLEIATNVMKDKIIEAEFENEGGFSEDYAKTIADLQGKLGEKEKENDELRQMFAEMSKKLDSLPTNGAVIPAKGRPAFSKKEG